MFDQLTLRHTVLSHLVHASCCQSPNAPPTLSSSSPSWLTWNKPALPVARAATSTFCLRGDSATSTTSLPSTSFGVRTASLQFWLMTPCSTWNLYTEGLLLCLLPWIVQWVHWRVGVGFYLSKKRSVLLRLCRSSSHFQRKLLIFILRDSTVGAVIAYKRRGHKILGRMECWIQPSIYWQSWLFQLGEPPSTLFSSLSNSFNVSQAGVKALLQALDWSLQDGWNCSSWNWEPETVN